MVGPDAPVAPLLPVKPIAPVAPDCDKPKLYYTILNGGTSGQVLTAGTGFAFADPTWKTVIAGWEVGSINYKPNRVHKFFMKLLLGWKWNG